MKYERPIMETIFFGITDVIITSQIKEGEWDSNKGNENISGDGF